MAIFSSLDDLKDHKQYVVLLKKALLTVKSESKKKFLYYKQYPFGPKKLPVVLVDYDPELPAALAKAGQKPLDEGIATLTDKDELNFEAKKGNLKRISLKKYFATMGTGIKPVFVPAGETDDEGTTVTRKEEPVDENEARRKQLQARIAELQAKTFPAKIEALKGQILEKAKTLGTANKFAEATGLLDQLAAKAGTGDTTTTPKAGTTDTTTAPKTTANDGFVPKWAAAKQSWEKANKTADQQIANLQKALRDSKDEDLEQIAEFGLNAVTGNFRARMIAFMMEMKPEEAEARAGTAKKGLALVSAFRTYIETDPEKKMKAADENPLKVPVTLRTGLGAALDDLAGALKAA